MWIICSGVIDKILWSRMGAKIGNLSFDVVRVHFCNTELALFTGYEAAF